VPLTLITGPANAAKAGALLDAYEQAADRNPILVVPTFPDVDFYQRDLARRGRVFGADVRVFDRLFDEIAKRTDTSARPLGATSRERVAARAIVRSDLDVLAPAAEGTGFAAHLVRFAIELEQSRIEPARFTQALRSWGEGGAYATEVARLYSNYRDELDRLGRPDPELARWSALDALREQPRHWGDSPVFFYGFDELDALQFDAIETLTKSVSVDVWFSLTYEAGHGALTARARTQQDLVAIGATETMLPASAEQLVAPELHAIERGLMCGEAAPSPPGAGVVLLKGGGERAEAELVGAKVRGLLDDGMDPHEIAIVHRDLDRVAPLLTTVLAGYGVPAAIPRKLSAGHTALGRGVVAALRCALGTGEAEDFVDYLRSPGLIADQRRVDALEAQIRIGGIRDFERARKLWTEQGGKADAIDWIARDARRGSEYLFDQLESQIAYVLARPHQRQADVFDADALVDARAAATLTSALRSFKRLPPQLAPGERELPGVLSELQVSIGARPGVGLVTVANPQDLRARQLKALVCMGLTQGVFPRPATPLQFFDDFERSAINLATGLGIRRREDALQIERFFFYMVCSRPTELLALSWPAADDDGTPKVRSLFVDDLLEVLDGEPQLERRELGAVGWAQSAPTAREQQRAALAAERGSPEPGIATLTGSALSAVRSQDAWSATALEAWLACPVRWLAESRLRLKNMEPEPEPLLRGRLTHRVLQTLFDAIDGPLTQDDLPQARKILDEVLAKVGQEITMSVDPERLAAEARRTEADLVAYIEYAATSGSSYIPERAEVGFGRDEDELPAVPLGDGEHKLRGVVDRIDEGPDGKAIVWDYKGRGKPPKQADWGARPIGEGKIQIALYMLAAERVMGYERAVGGLYQPLNARDDARPRGLMVADEDPGLNLVANDRVDDEAARELLRRCEADALRAIAEIRDGLLTGRPGQCGWKNGVCEHPSICRHERADL
jgi:ATP-dependent helicase/DNAse subunit B